MSLLRSSRYLLLTIVISAPLAGCAIVFSSQHPTEEYTTFLAAVNGGDLKTVQADLEADPSLIHAKDWSGASPLHDAVGQNYEAEVAYLLSKGADVNATTKDGLTPLHMAAQNGNIPMMELLLAHGARINAVDGKGWTPLDRAQKWEHPDAAGYLRNRGAQSG